MTDPLKIDPEKLISDASTSANPNLVAAQIEYARRVNYWTPKPGLHERLTEAQRVASARAAAAYEARRGAR